MDALLQVLLGLVAWLSFVSAPAAHLGYEDRNLTTAKKRGVSIFPGIPLFPLLFLGPLPFLGAHHVVMRVILWVHVAVLLGSLTYVCYWLARARRDG